MSVTHFQWLIKSFVLPTAVAAEEKKVPVFKYKRWQLRKQAVPEVVAEYRSVGAELNVMPFCSQFIPTEVITHPKHQSIIYHPSLLPRHRGASAINWWAFINDSVSFSWRCGSSRFPLSLSEWSFTICMMPYNHK